MIATISEANIQESLNTLNFAQRAKEVVNNAEKNFDINGDSEMLRIEIAKLMKEIEEKKAYIG